MHSNFTNKILDFTTGISVRKYLIKISIEKSDRKMLTKLVADKIAAKIVHWKLCYSNLMENCQTKIFYWNEVRQKFAKMFPSNYFSWKVDGKHLCNPFLM